MPEVANLSNVGSSPALAYLYGGISSIGRPFALHARSCRFESGCLHLLTMKYLIHKDKRKRKLFQKVEKTQRVLKSIISDESQEENLRQSAYKKLNYVGKIGSRTKIHNRCLMSGRSKSVYRKFKVSRIELRELALKGSIPGYTKKSW